MVFICGIFGILQPSQDYFLTTTRILTQLLTQGLFIIWTFTGFLLWASHDYLFRLLAILSGLLRLSLLASQYIFLDALLSYKRRHMGFCNYDGDLYIVILAADESLSGVHLS